MNKNILRLSAVGVAAVLGLAGCAAGSKSADNAVPADQLKSSPKDTAVACAPSGSVVEALKVTGEHDKEIKIEGGTPAAVDKQQTLVLEKGKGKKLEKGMNVKVHVSLFNGKDGKALADQSGAVELDEKSTPAWLGQALACGTTDGRVVSAVKLSQAFEDPKQIPGGLQADDTVIMVFDMNGTGPGTLPEDKLLKKAEGEAKPAPAGFPTVKLNDDGSPQITIPDGLKAPDKLSIATLIEGKGDVVKPGDRVYVNYRGVIWRDGKEFDSSWKRGKPVDFTTDGVIKGFKQALEGHTVGSQVIAVVPANDGGYGPDALQQQGHQPDDVMVFVLDILGTAHGE